MLVAPSAAERIGLRLENQLLQHVSPRFEPQLAIGSSVTAFLQSSGCFLRYLLSVHTNLARPVVEINGILAVPYARQHIECRLTVYEHQYSIASVDRYALPVWPGHVSLPSELRPANLGAACSEMDGNSNVHKCERDNTERRPEDSVTNICRRRCSICTLTTTNRPACVLITCVAHMSHKCAKFVEKTRQAA